MKDCRTQDVLVYERSTRLHIVPNERPNVVKVSIQKAALNAKGEWYHKTVKSFRMTLSQANQFARSVGLLASEHWETLENNPKEEGKE